LDNEYRGLHFLCTTYYKETRKKERRVLQIKDRYLCSIPFSGAKEVKQLDRRELNDNFKMAAKFKFSKIIEFKYHILRYEFGFTYLDEQIKEKENDDRVKRVAKVLKDGSLRIRYKSNYFLDIRAALTSILSKIKEDVDLNEEVFDDDDEEKYNMVTTDFENDDGEDKYEKDAIIDQINDTDELIKMNESINEGDGDNYLIERNRTRRKKKKEERKRRKI